MLRNEYELVGAPWADGIIEGFEVHVTYANFSRRSERSRFIAEQFGEMLAGSVLDVGCDEAHLRRLSGAQAYYGIDVAGSPDRVLDVETVGRLPFSDGQFDTVVCSDVLEHLDNLHDVFSELVRVTRRHLLISLPNNWSSARAPIGRGYGSFAHYGLPPDKPRDRHKWFFSLSEASEFVIAQERRHPVRLERCFATEKPRPWIARMARRLRYPQQMRYLNRYAHTLWAVYEKRADVQASPD